MGRDTENAWLSFQLEIYYYHAYIFLGKKKKEDRELIFLSWSIWSDEPGLYDLWSNKRFQLFAKSAHHILHLSYTNELSENF